MLGTAEEDEEADVESERDGPASGTGGKGEPRRGTQAWGSDARWARTGREYGCTACETERIAPGPRVTA